MVFNHFYINKEVYSTIRKGGPLLIIILLNIIMYTSVIGPKILEKKHLPIDIYRDIAYARHILEGKAVFSDPAIKGEYIWYPPLSPLIVAGLSKLTSVSIFTLYSNSVFIINFMIPILFYLLISQLFGKLTAFFSTLLMVNMPWINTHFFSMALVSVHGVAVVLGIFIYFVSAHNKGLSLQRMIILGVLMGLALLHHSLSGLILYGMVFFYICISLFRNKSQLDKMSCLAALIIPVIIWSPYWIPNLFQPKLNPTSLNHIAKELFKPEFIFIPNEYLFSITLLLFGLGLVYMIRKKHRFKNQIFLIVLAILFIGQLAAYIRYFALNGPEWARILKHLPILIPHEFQWFFQLFILPVIITGYWIVYQKFFKNKNRIIKYLCLLFLTLPGILILPSNFSRFFMKYSPGQEQTSPAHDWIKRNISKEAVIICGDNAQAYYDIQPYTGRYVIATIAPYMNYNINANERLKDKKHFVHSANLLECKTIIDKYKIEYFILYSKDIKTPRLSFFIEHFKIVYRNNKNLIIFSL